MKTVTKRLRSMMSEWTLVISEGTKIQLEFGDQHCDQIALYVYDENGVQMGMITATVSGLQDALKGLPADPREWTLEHQAAAVVAWAQGIFDAEW